MKINIAESAGFCFGVKRAIEIAKKTIKDFKEVYISGDLVHNEDITKELRRLGIKKIKRLQKCKGKIFLIRAHGEPQEKIERAVKLGYKIIDATCPMVKDIHRIVREQELAKRRIIVIGDKNHEEVLGIIGQLKQKPTVIDPKEDFILKIKKIKNLPCSVVVQSTQDLEKIENIFRVLKDYIKDIRFFNTICNPTRKKQQEIRKLSKENDLIIIIGSKTSANTKRLYEIAFSLNRATYWIQDKKEIQKSWFNGIKSVGITAGASTPDEKIKEVISFIKTKLVYH
jgi:4-hydroxy-3-methylbut-2-enyl diphosphate reductase